MGEAKAALSSGRAAYLERKRDATRAAILLAARDIFAVANYADAKVEDIFRRAGVSRATFYSHFTSKLELAYAIYDEIAPQTTALFLSLPARAESGTNGIRLWLDAFIALHVAHRYVTPLIAQLQLFESEFRRRILRDAEALIDHLGDAGNASFRYACGHDKMALRHRVRARLLLNRVAAVCAEIARGEISGRDAEVYLDFIEAELRAFMDEHQDPRRHNV